LSVVFGSAPALSYLHDNPSPEGCELLLSVLSTPDGAHLSSAKIAATLAAAPNNEIFNDPMYRAWREHDQAQLSELIRRQNRKPSSITEEALFLLAHNDLAAYRTLNDTNGEILADVWRLASSEWKPKIRDHIINSGDGRLIDLFQKAIRTELDPTLYVASLKKAGDHQALFKAAKKMTALELLDLLEFWEKNAWKPTDTTIAAVIGKVMEIYKKLGEIEIKPVPALPTGTGDFLAWCQQQQLAIGDIKKDMNVPNPFIRLRALVLGHEQGLVDAQRWEQAANSDDWPERLGARLSRPQSFAGKNEDHVHWVNICGDIDNRVLAARVECTPNEDEEYTALSHHYKRGGAYHTRGAQILACVQLFQGYWSTHIVVDQDDSAPVPDAVEAMDAGEVEF
jgi:hypothetical protein